MKKLALSIIVCVCTVAVGFGQTVKLGAFLGPNLSTIGSQDAEDQTTGWAVGWHAGLFTEIGLGHWSVEPALVYASIGGKINLLAIGGDEGTETVLLQYLQVPVNLVYNTNDRKFFFGGGPYVGFGLSGSENGSATSSFEGISGFNNISQKVAFNSSTNPDYGISLLAGVHLKGGTMFTLGGIIGLRQGTTGITVIRNDVISLSVGHSIF
jgi:hypothetical protein